VEKQTNNGTLLLFVTFEFLKRFEMSPHLHEFLICAILLSISIVVLNIMSRTRLSTEISSSYEKVKATEATTTDDESFNDNSRRTTFLIGIFSTMEDNQTRSIIRKTMLGNDLPDDVKRRLCNLNEFLNITYDTTKCRIVYTFVIGGNASGLPALYTTDDMIFDAHNITSQEKDLTILNIKENANEGKTPTWFLYASTIIKSKIDYVSKMDSDTFISLPNLLQVMNNELPGREGQNHSNVYGGVMADFSVCRGTRRPFYRCKPIRRRFFMLGQFYFLSHSIVTLNVLWIDPIHHSDEDVTVATRLWKTIFPLRTMIYNNDKFWKNGLVGELNYWNYFEMVKNQSWTIHESGY
jgi:Galactosyltransferase